MSCSHDQNPPSSDSNASDAATSANEHPTTCDDEEQRSFREKIRIFEEFSAPPPINGSARRDLLGFGLFKKRNHAKHSPGTTARGRDARSKKSLEFAIGSNLKNWHSTPTLGEQQGGESAVDSHQGATANGDVANDAHAIQLPKKPHWTVRLSNRLHRLRHVFEQKRVTNGPPRSDQGYGHSTDGVSSSRLSLVSVFPDLDIEDGVKSPVSKEQSKSSDDLVHQVVSDNSNESVQEITAMQLNAKSKTNSSEKGSFIAELLLKFSQNGGGANGAAGGSASADKTAKKDLLWTIKNKKKLNKQPPVVDMQTNTYVEAERIDGEVDSGQIVAPSSTDKSVSHQMLAADHQNQQQQQQQQNGHRTSAAAAAAADNQ
jgi:hypothetical protein